MSKLLNSLPIYIMSQESDNSTNNQRKDALNNMNNEFMETLNDLMLKKKKFQKKINKEKSKLTDLLQNLNTLTVEKNTLEIKISEKFVGERGRINCSLREIDGFWRWLGIQFVVSEK